MHMVASIIMRKSPVGHRGTGVTPPHDLGTNTRLIIEPKGLSLLTRNYPGPHI